MPAGVFPGKSYPLGATVYTGGANFSIFSKNAEKMELLLFNLADNSEPARVITLDAKRNRTFYYWHVYVPGLTAGQIYAWRAHGPWAPEEGLRFDGDKVLLDPYSRCIVKPKAYDRIAAFEPGDNCSQALKCVVVDSSDYDWEGDVHPKHSYSETIIYEMHVGGFTRNPNSGVSLERQGTYAGVIDKIPYLKKLGVTAVELLPIHQFDEMDAPLGHENYWGYSTIGFFAPHSGYAASGDKLGPVNEFRDMVKALHKADIEVILDVVFNHTAEGDHRGPTMSFRGLENSAYYILEKEDDSRYTNFSGCGNTVNANHSIMRRLICDCLQYWVAEMHIDGFRFDLASVLSRDEEGHPLDDPPILWSIDSDPVLAGTKLIAEAWDAAGLYQVGSFSGDRFAEWNGPFRDDIRRFVKDDSGMVPIVACRILGSPDLYRRPGGEVGHCINFITCHDGFTLADLVSYNEKHNDANGEDNRDGSNNNISWNCGVEGATDDPVIDLLRLRQIKNFLAILILAQGTPMLWMGDEVRRSQRGNNNAYCQNNELGWFDWDDVENNDDLLEFLIRLIAFRRSYRIFAEEKFWRTEDDGYSPSITWHGQKLNDPDWHAESRILAYQLRHPEADERIFVILNSHWKSQLFMLPPLPVDKRWHRVMDTSLNGPDAMLMCEQAEPIHGEELPAEPRSTIILIARSCSATS
ncbi:MAG: glycogen debranching protein GlgX [bacterium]|nr:glycogen debranching protein GlgX [bacterium]